MDDNADRVLVAEEMGMGSDKVEPIAVRTVPEIVITSPQN